MKTRRPDKREEESFNRSLVPTNVTIIPTPYFWELEAISVGLEKVFTAPPSVCPSRPTEFPSPEKEGS